MGTLLKIPGPKEMPDFTKWRPPLELVLTHGGTKKSKKYVEWAKIEWLQDESPDLSWLEQTVEDYMGGAVTREEAERYVEENRKRLQAHGTDWFSVGLRAKATVILAGTTQHVSSPGLWGIESDAGETYFRSIAREEIVQLNEILEAMGLTEKPYVIDEVTFP